MIQVSHLAELANVLNAHGVAATDVCIVGGAALAFAGIRSNNDLDIVVRPDVAKRLPVDGSTSRLSANVDVKIQWLRAFGVSDEELIQNSRYHQPVESYQVARPELVHAFKTHANRAHDRIDVELIGQWAISNKKWDWQFCLEPVPVAPAHRSAHLVRRGARKLLKDPRSVPKAFLATIRSALRPVGSRLARAMNARRIRLSQIRTNSELRALASSGILSACPVVRLVNAQYVGGTFNRYDLAVRWLAIEEYFGKNTVGFGLYNKMQDNRGTRRNSETRFRWLIDSVCNDGLDSRSSVEIDSQGRLGSGSHRLALAMYLGVHAIQVRISNTQQDKPIWT